jgi:hypothetical protein
MRGFFASPSCALRFQSAKSVGLRLVVLIDLTGSFRTLFM